jgi:hypothetical protein
MFRKTLRGLATPSSTPNSPAALQELRRKVLARYSVVSTGKAYLTRDDFIKCCTTSHLVSTMNPQDAMTVDEANTFLDSLHKANVVIYHQETQLVHVRPLLTLNRIQGKMDLPLIDPALEVRSFLNSKVIQAENLEKAATPGLVEIAKRRKRFWGTVAVASGGQMAFLSYLQFIVYGWDVMEPACYFLTSATALVCYCYMLFFRREHSYAEVDANLVPRQLDKRWQSVDVPQWIRVLKEIDSLELAATERGKHHTMSAVLASGTAESK